MIVLDAELLLEPRADFLLILLSEACHGSLRLAVLVASSLLGLGLGLRRTLARRLAGLGIEQHDVARMDRTLDLAAIALGILLRRLLVLPTQVDALDDDPVLGTEDVLDLPSLPLSLPAITTTLSPFLIFIFIGVGSVLVRRPLEPAR